MTTIAEGALAFRFPAGCNASKYDEWSFYRNQFQRVANGCKAVEVLCVDNNASWLIEVKDYRQHPRTKAVDIADELAIKVRDTLAGLAAAAKCANKAGERRYARRPKKRRQWRVVLHLEQSVTSRRLQPKAIDPSTILLKIRSKKLKAVDAHPIVCDRNRIPDDVPWTVQQRSRSDGQ